MGYGSSIAAGAAMGGASGLALGGVGAIGGAIIGGGLAAFAEKQSQDAQAKIRDRINEFGDYRESEAYLNAANQAGRADRWAQQGMSSQEYNSLGQQIDRNAAYAQSQGNDMRTGLQGMSAVQGKMNDAFMSRSDMTEEIKRGQQAQALTQQGLFGTQQQQAFEWDATKNEMLLNLELGDLESTRTDLMNMQKSIGTGMQNYANNPAIADKMAQNAAARQSEKLALRNEGNGGIEAMSLGSMPTLNDNSGLGMNPQMIGADIVSNPAIATAGFGTQAGGFGLGREGLEKFSYGMSNNASMNPFGESPYLTNSPAYGQSNTKNQLGSPKQSNWGNNFYNPRTTGGDINLLQDIAPYTFY